jgi:formate hydrogenlyase subunit 3/multisubunit Na+/H+ antiporter MnhD subunit
VVVLAIVLLTVAFAGMLRSVNQMLYGAAPERVEHGDVLRWSLAPLVLNVALLLVLGLTLPRAVADALAQALSVLGVPHA